VKANVNFKALPFAARCTIVMFGMTGFAAILYALSWQPVLSPGRFFMLLSIAAISSRAKVKLYRGSTISFLTCIVLMAVIREGPAVAVLLGVCGVTTQMLLPNRRIVLHQLAFNAGMIALTILATWWIHNLLSAGPIETIYKEVTATVLASFTYFLGNSISVSLIVSLSQKMSILHIWSEYFLYSAPSFLFAGLLSIVVLGLAAAHFAIAAVVIGVIAAAYYCSVRLAGQPAR
jgi:hypothetical protein